MGRTLKIDSNLRFVVEKFPLLVGALKGELCMGKLVKKLKALNKGEISLDACLRWHTTREIAPWS